MKLPLLISFCILFMSTFAQKQDTTFLKPRNQEGHAIYIDPSPDSEYYEKIADISYTLSNKDYKESMERLNIHKKPFNQIDLTGIPRNWCALELYKGKYYVYAPSEWSYTRVSLNDSTVIQQDMERSISLLDATSKIDKNSYKFFRIKDYTSQRNSFTIHIIDVERGIAVFENLYSNPFGKLFPFKLMVDINKIKEFPIVVNYSPQHRELEFVFDEPDFKELLKHLN